MTFATEYAKYLYEIRLEDDDRDEDNDEVDDDEELEDEEVLLMVSAIEIFD